jgi:hypothetical protein
VASVAPLSFLLGVLILILTAPIARAAWSNDPLTFVLDEREIHNPVGHETWCGDCVFTDWTTQEPWVVNPTTCMWDVDDEFTYRSVGNVLGPGAMVSVTECALRSGQLFAAPTKLSSSSPDLIVTYSFTWDTGSYVVSVPPIFDETFHVWRYDACIRSPGLFGGTEVEVEGSHGGTAVPTTIEVSITNPTRWKVNKTGGAIALGWIPYSIWCS